MTIKAYISSKLQAFNITDADFADIEALGLDLTEDIKSKVDEVNKAIIPIIEGLIFSPKIKSVNESGFSVSWDMDGLAKWYLWLCRKYGVKPNEEILAMLNVSTIIDKTDIW